jgi:hypothetical protein
VRTTIFNGIFIPSQETTKGFSHISGNISSISQMGISRNHIWIPDLRDIIDLISACI